MKQNYNQKTGKHEWIVTTWYEKTACVIGYVWTSVFVLAFLVGMLMEIFN